MVTVGLLTIFDTAMSFVALRNSAAPPRLFLNFVFFRVCIKSNIEREIKKFWYMIYYKK
jgi:hypothetical protein